MHRYYKDLATYEKTHIGQLVVIYNKKTPYGHGPSVKVHWFNKRGVFVGNHYEFFEWDRWWGSSKLMNGGGAIADTGDHFDCTCPICEKPDPPEKA